MTQSSLPNDVVEGMEQLDNLVDELFKQGIIITCGLDVIVTSKFKIYQIIKQGEYRTKYEEELYGVN